LPCGAGVGRLLALQAGLWPGQERDDGRRPERSQFEKLKQLKGEKRNLADYVVAVRRVGDAEAIKVTATSAALCASGLASEKR